MILLILLSLGSVSVCWIVSYKNFLDHIFRPSSEWRPHNIMLSVLKKKGKKRCFTGIFEVFHRPFWWKGFSDILKVKVSFRHSVIFFNNANYRLIKRVNDPSLKVDFWATNAYYITRHKESVITQCETLINNLLTVALDHHRHWKTMKIFHVSCRHTPFICMMLHTSTWFLDYEVVVVVDARGLDVIRVFKEMNQLETCTSMNRF